MALHLLNDIDGRTLVCVRTLNTKFDMNEHVHGRQAVVRKEMYDGVRRTVDDEKS